MTFDFDLSFLLQMLVFASLIVVLRPLLFDPVLRVFEERERRTDGARDSARAMQEEAGALLSRYERSWPRCTRWLVRNAIACGRKPPRSRPSSWRRRARPPTEFSRTDASASI